VHSDADIVIASVCMWEARKKIIERQKEKKISITELLIYIVLSLSSSCLMSMQSPV
jgi:hypothetical protein